jgi:hypothetical protein
MSALIGGLIGAGAGILSSIFGGNEQAAAYEEQKRNAWQRYLINQQFADTQFGLNKSESLTALGIQQRRLGEDLNAGVDSFNTGLLGQAYGIQDAQIGLAGQLGAFDAAQGASGTRGNEANGLVKAYAQQSFDRNVALQGKQNDQALAGMMTQANRASSDIRRERDSWSSGGYRTQLFNAESERNRKLAELGQQELQYAADQARPGIFDVLVGGLSGASMGIGLGNSITEAQSYSGGRNVSGGGALQPAAGASHGGFGFAVNPYRPSRPAVNSFGSIGGYMQNTSGLGVTYGGNPFARPW